MIPATIPIRNVNRKKNQYSLRLALPVKVAYLLKHVEIALPIDFSSVGFKKCTPRWDISRENSNELQSLLLCHSRLTGLYGQGAVEIVELGLSF